MTELLTVFKREFIYIWYYFGIQFRQICWYWILGILIGSFISVFAKDRIHGLFSGMQNKKLGFLLNPQLIIYSTALGTAALMVRIVSCFLCGCAAGLLVFLFFRNREFFDFSGFEKHASLDTHPNLLIRYLLNVWRNVKATGLYFLLGILLSALFQRYVPQSLLTEVFGGNEAWGVLMAATIGVPLYACGGGTIPLLQEWLMSGMSLGNASAFMITGPATKITNLGALKIGMGWKRFFLYLIFVMSFSFFCGIIVNTL